MLAVAAVGFPVLGALAVGLLPEKHRRARVVAAASVALISAGIVYSLIALTERGAQIEITAWRVGPLLTLKFVADRLGLLFAGIASTLWVFTTIYSHGYLDAGPNLRRYFTFLTVSLTATLGVALAGNLFTLYLFYELLTLVTYPLVVHDQTPDASRAGRTYIAYSLVGAALVLLGIVGAVAIGGSLDLRSGGLLAGAQPGPLVYFTAGCFAAGFGVKAAVMPLHGWLPQAMVAPTPVSALLHAVAVVKSGVFGLLRIAFFVFGTGLLRETGLDMALAWLAGITIVLASISALRQDVLKRRLAYSTISQLGYITFGAAMLEPQAIAGGLLHLFAHSLMKITLFFCAGIIITQTGRTKISQLDGIGRRLPWTMGAFTVAALGMVGIVPVCGYVSKWYLLLGGLRRYGWGPAALLLGSSLLNAAYFFPIVIRAFFRPYDKDSPRPGLSPAGEAPPSMVWTTLLLALSCIVVGIFPQPVLGFLQRLVAGL
jgi:multicomponent Na+:H+ antiporter subunit D